MNMTRAIQYHESLAAQFAKLGKAKSVRAHKLRAEQLRVVKQIRQELRQ